MSTKTNSASVSSAKMIYAIFLDGSVYSLHLTSEERDEYLDNLQLVKPDELFETQEIPTGRCKGEEKKVWGAWGWFADGKVSNFRVAWVFPRQLSTTVKDGQWVCLTVTDEGRFLSTCRKLWTNK